MTTRSVEWSPRLLMSGDLESVSAGWTHACALLRGGKVHAWGRNNYSQCGRPVGAEVSEQDRTPQMHSSAAAELMAANVRKVVAGSEHCLCLTGDGRVVAWGWNEHGSCGTELGECVPAPRALQLGDHKVTDVFTGSAHSFALIP